MQTSKFGVQKTPEEHRIYLHEIVRLKLWFLWYWLKKRPGEEFKHALRERVDIFRKCDFWRGTFMEYPTQVDYKLRDWRRLENQSFDIYRVYCNYKNALAFEENAFELFRDTIDKRSYRDYIDSLSLDFQCGSLKYDPPTKKNPLRVLFHIENAIQPISFLDDQRYIADCFHCLMRKSEIQYNVNALSTNSWLNSYSKWLKLFPRTYIENMGIEDKNIRFTRGFWGQFINAKGIYNKKNGDLLRETGRFPFYRRLSWCNFKDMQLHLHKKL